MLERLSSEIESHIFSEEYLILEKARGAYTLHPALVALLVHTELIRGEGWLRASGSGPVIFSWLIHPLHFLQSCEN